METATNRETGERLVRIGGQWTPYDASATNDEGKKLFKVGGQWVSDDEDQPDVNAFTATTKGINAGLTGALGAPVDLINAGLSFVGLDSETPVGGTKSLRKGLNYALPGATYENIKEIPEEYRPLSRAGEVIGGSVPFAAAPFASSKALTAIPGVVRPIVAAARESPKAFAAAEAGSTFGAAQGAAIAELVAPGNTGAAVAGEMAGGFVSPSAAVTRGAKMAAGGVGTFLKSFTKAGRTAKAAETIQDALRKVGEDPLDIAARLREADDLGLSMTAGQKSESPTLLAFETTMASKNPDFDAATKLRAKEDLGTLRKLIGDLSASGDPELLAIAAKTREQYFRTLLNGRMKTADTQAQLAAKALSGDKAASSVRATNIIETSLKDARNVESILWEKIPKTEKLAGSGILEAHGNVRSSMLPEEPLPPAFVEQFVARVKDGQGITSGEVLRFRSQMLSRARDARGQKKWGEARIYEEMADGALADISEVPGEATKAARTWSKELNDAFTRTFAEDALAVKGTGARRIVPEAVLERAFGGGGTLANKRFEQLQNASAFAGPKAGMLSEQEEFLRAAAKASTDPQTGAVNLRSLESFKRNNAALLERFPALKQDLSNAVSAGQAFSDVQAATKTASKAIQQRAAFSKVIEGGSPADTVARIIKSDNAQSNYMGLVKLARRGGENAVDGLKAATLDYAAKAATSNTGVFSFAKYRQLLRQSMGSRGPSIMDAMKNNGVMPAAEVSRMNILLKHAERIERSITSKAHMAELIAEPDMLFDLVVRAVGANVGGASALGQASGAPLVMAGAGTRAARRLMEKVPTTRVMDVLMEAAKNPVLMARLLEKPANFKRTMEVQRQVNAFLLRAGLVPREEQENPRTPAPQSNIAPQQLNQGVQNAPQGATTAAAVSAPVQAGTPPTEAVAAPPITLDAIPKGLKISLPVLIEDSGSTVTVQTNAREAMQEVDERISRGQALLEALGR